MKGSTVAQETTDQRQSTPAPTSARRKWEAPRVVAVGNIATLVQIHKVSGGHDTSTHHDGSHLSF
jgi:hypothetical protein